MIEVYFITKKKDRLMGYINDREILDKKQRRRCRVDLDAVYSHSRTPVMQLMENGDIINLEKSIAYESGEILGYMKNFQILDSLKEPYYRLSKEEGIIYACLMEKITPWWRYKNVSNQQYQKQIFTPWLRLVGDLTSVDEIVFLGLCFYFLNIFC